MAEKLIGESNNFTEKLSLEQIRSKFIRLCVSQLEARGLSHDARYRDRLKKEIKEIDAQGEHEYFLKLYYEFKKEGLIFPENEHNLLVAWLLDLVPDFDIDKEYAWIQGEFPDVDIDYLKPVRDYLKREWAPNQFGKENVCEIGTYGTAGIKSSILDLARVFGKDIHEIQSITKYMDDKDDEGNILDWEKAKELYEDFRKYCENNKEVEEAARLFQGRITHAGVHAGGLIISSKRIDGFVPLEVRCVRKDNPQGVVCSAWTEGLVHQDLQPVGLIKFDLLVINNLMQIATACHLVKQRHNIDKICARDGDCDWSDTSYLNDPAALEMANRGDLRCIFQFNGDGIQKLVRRGGVNSFDDLVAYSALYRPGCLKVKMDEEYCKRKKGETKYELHPLLEPILGNTYGVIVYQEQVMEILRVVGNIPDMHTEKVRKAISKKRFDEIVKYKEMFIENGQRNLGKTKEELEEFWKQIESWAEYGFNKSHACAYSYISSRLLYLKAHYPIEFYTAILMNETDTDKYFECLLDAKEHGIEVCPVDINKSKENFHIHDNKIYFGFSNIKGIGEEVAKKIVENQPYSSFFDFLERFGTDAIPVKALVAVGCFDSLEPNADRLKLRKFFDYYKQWRKKVDNLKSRWSKWKERTTTTLDDILGKFFNKNTKEYCVLMNIDDKNYLANAKKLLKDKDFLSTTTYRGKVKQSHINAYHAVCSIIKKYQRAKEKIKLDFEKLKEKPNLYNFDDNSVAVPEKELRLLTNRIIFKDFSIYPDAELHYYGFRWIHEIKLCKDYEGYTLSRLAKFDNKENKTYPIEVKILNVERKISKKSHVYYLVHVEDENFSKAKVLFWENDYQRWKKELACGNYVRMRVTPSSDSVYFLLFEKFSKRNFSNIKKEDDYRLMLLEHEFVVH